MRHVLPLLLAVALLGGGLARAEEAKAPPLDPTTRDFHQRHLEIHVTPDIVAGSVKGEVRVAFESLVDALKTLRLHCLETQVQGVVGEKGQALPHALKDGVLSVELAAALGRGQDSAVTIAYVSKPTQGLFFHKPTKEDPSTPLELYSQGEGTDNRRWIPCYDEPDDRCSWEVHATVAADLETISNGVLKGSTKNDDGTRTDHWDFDARGPTYLISLIVGRFATVTDKWKDVVLEYHGPVGREEDLKTALGQTPAMMQVFSDYTGLDYPWPRYAQTFVWDFVYGGMENTTATTLNIRALHGPKARPNYRSEGLVSHELAHMWFGDLLTCRTWDHIWLNEGFATYFTDLYFESRYGTDELLLRRRDQNADYMRGTPDPAALDLKKKPRGDVPLELHGGKQYDRGAAILHTLRREIGDTAFKEGVRRYVAGWRDCAVATEDLRVAMEQAAGQDLRWFFDQWVYGVGYPVLEVSHDAEKGRLLVKQVQPRKGGQGLFRISVPVRWGATGPVTWLHVYREEHSFGLKKAGPFLRFGVGGDLLMQVKLEQDLEAWKAALASDPDVNGRLDAVEALEEFGTDAVDAVAVALAKDGSFAVRRECARALSRLGGGEPALRALLSAMGDADSRVREAVMTALGERRRDRVAAPLLGVVKGDANDYVRAAAVRSLAQVKAPGAFETLRDVLATADSHGDVIRTACLDGLRSLGDRRALELAPTYLDYEWGKGGTHGVRRAALECLTALGGDDAVVRAKVVTLLSDPYHTMRSWAAEACGKYEIREAVEPLKALAEKDWHGGVKGAANTALERLGVKK
jgi:aminopeptidase N